MVYFSDFSAIKVSQSQPSAVVSISFLVAVNQTDDLMCLATVKTAPLKPGVLHNQSDYIHVGKCDYGALDFNITTESKNNCVLLSHNNYF